MLQKPTTLQAKKNDTFYTLSLQMTTLLQLIFTNKFNQLLILYIIRTINDLLYIKLGKHYFEVLINTYHFLQEFQQYLSYRHVIKYPIDSSPTI